MRAKPKSPLWLLLGVGVVLIMLVSCEDDSRTQSEARNEPGDFSIGVFQIVDYELIANMRKAGETLHKALE